MTAPVATAARVKVYPKHVSGTNRKIRNGISIVLQALFFVGPWISWKGQQAVLADVLGRKLYLFDLVIHPQETYFLHVLLILAAVTLFFSTAIAGRMWCGYACPQTLFTQSFIFVERLIEGDRARRMRLDKAPWSAEKIARKTAKFAVWGVMAVWLGVTFAKYFLPFSAATVGFFTLVALFEFGWFREQFCNYLCPYARFQGSMIDAHSRIIAYDKERGDCIDCTLCAQVCPMGIDIRDGLQLECINCSACVDVCDEVMDKVKKPRGLIRATSLKELQGSKPRLVRPRTVVYAVLWVALAGTLLGLFAKRGPLGLDVVRQQAAAATFSQTPDGRVSNAYKVDLMNRTREPQTVRLELRDFPSAELVMPQNPVTVGAGEVATLSVMVVHPVTGCPPLKKFYFVANSNLVKEASFLGPLR